MKINFKEASTKRAIVMTITGLVTLYQIAFGSGSPDIDALLARVEWWMGIGLTIVGMFGFLPDQPPRTGQERTRATDLPPNGPVKNAYDIALEESVCVDGLDRESVARPFKPPLRQREIMNETDLPNIELQGRSEAVSEDRQPVVADQPERVDVVDVGVRLDVPPDPFIESHEQSVRSGQDGYNG